MSPRRKAKPTVEQETTNLQTRLVEIIDTAMAESGFTRADLARALDISRASVTQTLKPDGNLTVDTIAKILYALDWRLTVDLESL